MVERFNATICRYLTKFSIHEEDWDKRCAFAVFRYNSSVNDATGVTPVWILFGVEKFEFEALVGL